MQSSTLQTKLEDIRVTEFKETGPQIDPFLEPIDALLREGQYDIAYRLLKILHPWQRENCWVEERLGDLYRRWIPRWHFKMLNDTKRGQAFADALRAVGVEGKTVLDIGTGSGLLAMLAVRAGAKHVYACEMVSLLAEAAVKIVRLNGMASKITIIPKSSFNLAIGKDMPARADVMLSETFDGGFVGEGFLSSLSHARKHLLQPDALQVPSAVQLCGMLINSPEIYHLNHVSHSQGFDVRLMNEFSTRGYFPVRLKARPHQIISDIKTILELDLQEPIPESSTRVIGFQATQDGIAHGVAFWFKVTLTPGVLLSNDPDRADSHWSQAFASFHEPMAVQKGESYSMELTLGQHAASIAPLERIRKSRTLRNY